jgi:predicted nucleic acid-binding protein
MPGSFLDTNVLVYLAQGDAGKAGFVEQLLGEEPVVSVQVLNELANVLRRKASFSWSETHDFLAIVRDLTKVVPLTIETHDLGLSIAERFTLSIYDAMIAAAAQIAECDVLWSEDMQHGLRLHNGLEIRNPFRGRAAPA